MTAEIVVRHIDFEQTTPRHMSGQKSENKTGIFHRSNPPAIVVMWRGQEICRYGSMEEFVDAHLAAVTALEKKQEDILMEEYRDSQ